MAAASPQVVSPKSQEALVQFYRQCYGMLNQQWNIRESMRRIDLAYMREVDWTSEQWKAKISNRMGDPTKFRNVVIPIIMPQVEAAVTYQASVFLTGYPMFGWVSAPGSETAAQQFQAITEENQIRGGWIQKFMMAFRDAFKYNIAYMECKWDRINTWAVETDMGYTAGKQGRPKQTIWEGNCISRWDPYNTFFDTRVFPTELPQKGEFAGNTVLMSRTALKRFLATLPDGMVQNYRAAFESGVGGASMGIGGIESYYQPLLNPDALMVLDQKRSFDWMAWAGILDRPSGEIQYKNVYEVSTLYARIIPQDFTLNVPSKGTVQIWKLLLVNHQVLVYCERQTNVHDLIPVFPLVPNEDGLGLQTKSLSDNAEPFQAVGSALVNFAIASRRRAVNDRMIYDPSRVSEAHINSDSPTAKIPLRPSAYGKPIGESVYAIPFRDEQSGVAFQELGQIIQMANMVNGQNQARQGQFVKGNKTLHEYESVMQNANGRDQMVAMLLEAQCMTPMKEVLKSNILQYQPSGVVYSASQKAAVQINPVELRQAMVTYKISDGLNPTDKIMSSDEFATAIQMFATSPTLSQGINLAPAVSYLFQTRNVDLSPFLKSPAQQAYEQAVQQWQELAIAMLQKGMDPKSQMPPQPNPQQYGYNPNSQIPGSSPQPQGTQQPQGGSPAQLPQFNPPQISPSPLTTQ